MERSKNILEDAYYSARCTPFPGPPLDIAPAPRTLRFPLPPSFLCLRFRRVGSCLMCSTLEFGAFFGPSFGGGGGGALPARSNAPFCGSPAKRPPPWVGGMERGGDSCPPMGDLSINLVS